MVKNLPAIQKTWVRSLGWEDPLEEGIATHSSILAWRIPGDRGDWWATVHGVAELLIRQNDSAQHSILKFSIKFVTTVLLLFMFWVSDCTKRNVGS